MANCLVTGHKGYIGSKLYAKLLELGHEVRGIDIKSNDIYLILLVDYEFRFLLFLPKMHEPLPQACLNFS